jgi:hypothetical protein
MVPSMETVPWDADEWQDRVVALARLRHGPENLQTIYDTYGGDMGIECYSLDGCAYQAYAPVEPMAEPDRYEKHRDKMSKDIHKFCVKNVADLEKLFGPIKIHRWLFMVPNRFAAKLTVHAQEKSEEVRSKALKYVAPHFQIVVCTDENFPEELAKLQSLGLAKLRLSAEIPPDEEIQSWASANTKPVETLKGKLKRLPASEDAEFLDDLTAELVRAYLHQQLLLDELKSHPAFHEEVSLQISSQRKKLTTLLASGPADAAGVFREQVRLLRDRLSSAVKSLSEDDLDTLTNGTICDWLVQCPLKFPAVAP